MSRAEVFDRIYRDNEWNGIETRSGPGSNPVATARPAEALRALVGDLGATHVLDVGCGEGTWMPPLPGYVGVDVSAEAIRVARHTYPDRTYMVLDPIVDPLPIASRTLIVCRDVIQHLSWEEGARLVTNIKTSGADWMVLSTYDGTVNVDIETGDAYCPDLTKAPFWLRQPDDRIFDGYTYHDPGAIRDARKFLGLWRLT